MFAGDDFIRRHLFAGFDFTVADKQADGYFAMQLRIAGDSFGETAGLIGCQSVHRVNDDRFNTGL